MCRVPWSFDSSEPDCIVFRGLWSSAGNKTTPFRPTPYQLGIATQAATGRICAIEIFMFQKRTYSWRRNDRGERICWTFWGGGGGIHAFALSRDQGRVKYFPALSTCAENYFSLFFSFLPVFPFCTFFKHRSTTFGNPANTLRKQRFSCTHDQHSRVVATARFNGSSLKLC